MDNINKLQQEIINSCHDRHPRLYTNLEHLLDQRQKIALSILTPNITDTELDIEIKKNDFKNVQDMIRKYIGL